MRVKTKNHSGGSRPRSNKRYPPSQAGGSALQALATWLPPHARKPNAGLSPTVSYLAALHLAPIDRPRGISVLSGLHWGANYGVSWTPARRSALEHVSGKQAARPRPGCRWMESVDYWLLASVFIRNWSELAAS